MANEIKKSNQVDWSVVNIISANVIIGAIFKRYTEFLRFSVKSFSQKINHCHKLLVFCDQVGCDVD